MTYPRIQKSDGSQEKFDPEKLRESLLKSGASKEEAEDVVEHILSEVKDGTTTKFIYDHAFELLKQAEGGVAARYSMRRALAELGPSGFPFERFVGELFRAEGYEVEVGKELEGECVSHEVDIVAQMDGDWVVGEVKFHKESHVKSDVQVALYVHARFMDLKKSNFDGIADDKEPHGTLITNTKFTSHAIKYGECAGLEMVGWSYPEKGNLQDRIEQSMLQPLTMLTKLSGAEKRVLLESGHALCREIRDNPEILDEVGIDRGKQEAVIKEVRAVCHL
ncbi:MAG: ATP cone domain-containing protein [Candidatus Paceibacterota bacterium]